MSSIPVRVRPVRAGPVQLAMTSVFAVVGLFSFDVSGIRAAEDINSYPALKEVLAEIFPEEPSAIVVITRVVNGEPEEEPLTLFDPDLAVRVPKDELPTGAHQGTFEIDDEVLTLTLSASPKCELKKMPDGDYVWVVKSNNPPCPPQ